MFRHAFPGLPRRIRGSGARTLLGLQLRVCPQPNECASWTRHIIRISLIVFVMRSHQTHLGHNKWSLICCFRSQSEIVFENERERERERVQRSHSHQMWFYPTRYRDQPSATSVCQAACPSGFPPGLLHVSFASDPGLVLLGSPME